MSTIIIKENFLPSFSQNKWSFSKKKKKKKDLKKDLKFFF